MNNPVKWYILSIVRAVLIGVLAVVVLIGGFLAIATIGEYRPPETETLAVDGVAQEFPAEKKELTVMSWNIGFASLGDDADYFLDGGRASRAESAERVEENLSAIVEEIRAEDADIVFLQEVDRDSSRSHRIKEVERLQSEFADHNLAFASDHKFFWVPYPLPSMLGKVDAGIATLSRYNINNAERVSLANPNNWPGRTINMKRCLLVSRVSLPDSDKELVMINLDLLTYDNGSGKDAQVEQLFKLMEEERGKGNFVIAGGDFNHMFSTVEGDPYPAQPYHWIAPTLNTSDYGDGWQFQMDPSAPTCRLLNEAYRDADKSGFQYYMLDGFIVSDNLKVTSCETRDLDFANSYHNPVVLKVEF